ncbi:MAG: Hint domain-containing protein [Paracoccaceae bacterium]
MAIPHSLARAAQNAVQASPILQDPAALRAPNRPQLRRYETMFLQPNGDIAENRHIAPALPLFESAFCAFSRGSLIETDQGPVAIEDLLPGDNVVTESGHAHPIQWIGKTTLVPGRPLPNGRMMKLVRIQPDALGMQKPMGCVITGPSARLLKTPGRLRALAGSLPMLTPVLEFEDGMNIVETAPPTPVELFHFCLPEHAIITIGGLQFETYHPGVNAVRAISPAMRSIYLGLFGHLNELRDFGTQIYPRSGDGEIDALSA